MLDWGSINQEMNNRCISSRIESPPKQGTASLQSESCSCRWCATSLRHWRSFYTATPMFVVETQTSSESFADMIGEAKRNQIYLMQPVCLCSPCLRRASCTVGGVLYTVYLGMGWNGGKKRTSVHHYCCRLIAAASAAATTTVAVAAAAIDSSYRTEGEDC